MPTITAHQRGPNSSAQKKQDLVSAKRHAATFSTALRGGGSIFSNAPLWHNSKVILGINALGWAINVFFPKCHYHVDLLGSGAFAVAAATAQPLVPTERSLWSSRAVMLWSTRLATFLCYRVFQNGHDGRLDEQLSTPLYAGQFWFVSALWGIVCSLPHTLGTTSSLQGSPAFTRAGGLMFASGLIMETLADYQKWQFKQSHPGAFCNVGVWSLSQHPNWFGNMLLWTGIYVMNAPALIHPQANISTWNKYGRLAVAALGPLFMLALFNGQATGAILGDSFQANREKYGYGKDPVFTNYIDTVPVLFPNPLKWFT